MTSAQLYTQLITKSTKNRELPNLTLLEKLDVELGRLTNLINELMEVNRINSGKLSYNFQKNNLSSIIEQALIDFKNVYKLHKLQYRDFTKGKSEVKGDYNKLLQVISNILTNAGKYSQPGTLVWVKLTTDNGYYLISIKDQGTGIPEKDIRHVFDQFYRGDETKKSGLGLGLYLSKRIIKKHKGDIKIISAQNQGTEVQIFLPKLLDVGKLL